MNTPLLLCVAVARRVLCEARDEALAFPYLNRWMLWLGFQQSAGLQYGFGISGAFEGLDSLDMLAAHQIATIPLHLSLRRCFGWCLLNRNNSLVGNKK
jgi:hypothetical protein